jgi:hypothetical protein
VKVVTIVRANSLRTSANSSVIMTLQLELARCNLALRVADRTSAGDLRLIAHRVGVSVTDGISTIGRQADGRSADRIWAESAGVAAISRGSC